MGNSSNGRRLEPGARVMVERRSANRHRTEKGFVGRSGEVIRIHYAEFDEPKVYVLLDRTIIDGPRREWLWASEIRVTGVAEVVGAAVVAQRQRSRAERRQSVA